MSNNRYPWRLAGFLMAYYASNALYQGYITLYLQSVGLAQRAIGLVMSALPLFAIAAQLFWGSASDRSANRTRVLRVALVLGAGLMALLGAARNGPVVFVALCLFGACYPAIGPMGDSVLLEALGDRPFGPLRIGACVAYAVSSLAFGAMIERNAALFPHATAAVLLGTALLGRYLPPLPGHQRKKEKVPIKALLDVTHMKSLVVLFMLLQLTMGYYFSFFPLYFTALPGASRQLLGISYLIATLSELPFLLGADALFRRLGPGRLMLAASAVLGARWILLALCPNVPAVMVGQLLHGGGFIVFTFVMAKFVAHSVPEALRTRGQSMLAVLGHGAARIAGNLLGTWLSGAFGHGTAFLIMGLICAATCVAFAPRLLKAAG